jgi:hypothetical protein
MFMKTKNYLEMPPIYPSTKPGLSERLAANEVYMLWDHLTFRYENLRLTSFFGSYVNDADLKALMALGDKVLSLQVKQLEEKLLYFGVALPRPYTPVVTTVEQTETIDDSFIFNTILRGIHDAIIHHASGLPEMVVNDGLKNYFIDLTLNELAILDKMLVYGQFKHWVVESPVYVSAGVG